MERDELFTSCTSQKAKPDLRGMGHFLPFAFHFLLGMPHEELFRKLKVSVEPRRAHLTFSPERT